MPKTPDEKVVIGRNPYGASMTIATKPVRLPSSLNRQRLPMRRASEAEEVRRGASEAVR
jgi:hypothetical protein